MLCGLCFWSFERFKGDMKKKTEIIFPHVVTALVTLPAVSSQPPYKIPHGEERDGAVASIVTDTCCHPCYSLGSRAPPAGGVPHVPPRPPPQEGDWRFTLADFN